MVVKAPAPEGGAVLLIVGQGDAGVIAGCRAVMDRTLLASLVGGQRKWTFRTLCTFASFSRRKG